MANILFINEKYLKDNTPVNNVDTKIVMCSIADAQERIEDSIGTALYRKLQNDVSANTVTGIYKTLLEDYIQPALKYYAVADLVYANHIKIQNKGSEIMQSENAKPAEDNKVALQIEYYKNKAQAKNQKLINYLKEHQTEFYEYLNPGTGWDVIIPKRSEKIFNGMYLPGGYVYDKKWGWL